MRIGNSDGTGTIGGNPLNRAGWNLGLYPIMFEQVSRYCIEKALEVDVEAPSSPLVIVSPPVPMPRSATQRPLPPEKSQICACQNSPSNGKHHDSGYPSPES